MGNDQRTKSVSAHVELEEVAIGGGGGEILPRLGHEHPAEGSGAGFGRRHGRAHGAVGVVEQQRTDRAMITGTERGLRSGRRG